MTDCIFCRIAAGAIPATILHQDDDVLAFRDVSPRAPEHVLVIPRRHVSSLSAVPEGAAGELLLGRVMGVACRVAAALGLTEATGYRTVINTGLDAGQTVPHLHVHLLGGRTFGWPPG